MAGGVFDPIILEESARLLKALEVDLTPCHGKHIALDIDVSCFDNSGTNKEGVSYTYKGFNGYLPVFAYLAGEGWLVNSLLQGRQRVFTGTTDHSRLHIKSLASSDWGLQSIITVIVEKWLAPITVHKSRSRTLLYNL